MKTTILSTLCASLCVLFATKIAGHGAAAASDNASDTAYNSGFNHNTNGGLGFAPWGFNNSVAGSTTVNSSFAGEFIGNSAANGSGASGNINVAGESWGLYANTNNTANATRPFLTGGTNSSNILDVAQSFSLQMDNGFLNTNASVGFGLQNGSGTNRIEFYFVGGHNFYDIKIAGTEKSTNLVGNGTPFTADGLAITFNQLAANGWTLDVTPNGGSLKTYSSADFGALASSDISQVRLFNFNNSTGGAARDAFFNSATIVPEPSSLILAVLTGSGVLALRRRRS